MSDAVDRRGFFRRFGGLVPDASTKTAAALPVADPAIDWLGDEDSAIAQLNEARPFLMEEARNAGIDVNGKSELAILRELFARAGGPPGAEQVLVRNASGGETT